jgi:hypothetical protein
LQEGEEICVHVVKAKVEMNDFVGNSLVLVYVKFKFVEVSSELFDKMFERGVVSWNVIIVVYTQNGYVVEFCVKCK